MPPPSSLALAGDAWRPLGERRPEFLAFVRRRVASPEVAEEIVQDALARAFEHRDQLRNADRSVAWFFRILRNAIVERARRDAVAARALQRLALEPELRAAASDAGPPPAACHCIRGVFDGLKDDYRAPLAAVDVEGRGLRDYARDAGITANSAAVRLHRARQALARGVQVTCAGCAPRGCTDCSCGDRA